MRFVFQPRKTAQAAAVLLKLASNKLNWVKIHRCLYVANRESLKETGSIITGGEVVLNFLEPTIKEILDYEKSVNSWSLTWRNSFKMEQSRWENKIMGSPKYLILCNDPGNDELSEYEEQLLVKTWGKYNSFSEIQLISDTLNDFPECDEFYDKMYDSVMYPIIPFEKILKAARVDDNTILEYQKTNEAICAMSEFAIVLE